MQCAFPPGFDGIDLLERLGRVLDPELDESILDLNFVRSLEVRSRHATVALELPTNWCAANFAFLMAEDIREALLPIANIDGVTIRLGDHFAAQSIETTVNRGRPFSEAFPAEGGGNLDDLRSIFMRKGFIVRQGRILKALLGASFSSSTICRLRLCDLVAQGDRCEARSPEQGWVPVSRSETLQHYLDRRSELGFDCAASAPLVIDLRGRPIPADQVEAHYVKARTVGVSLEANGSFCRAVLEARSRVTTGLKKQR